jgi:hypothetical protein
VLRRRPVSRRRWAASAVVLVLAVTAGCGGSSARQALAVYNPDDQRAGEQQGLIRKGVPYTFATGFPLCTTDGVVTITSVSLHDPHGPLELVDWAVWPTYGYRDTVAGSAKNSPYALPPRVSDACNDDVRQLLAVSMKLTGTRAFTLGFDVRSDGGSVTVPFEIGLCVSAHCPRPDVTGGGSTGTS